MILTDRDKDILRFIEYYKSSTIDQIAKIFYTNNKERYQMARKRLKLLYENKFIKRYRENNRSNCIYYINKRLSTDSLKLLDVYAELVNEGIEIKYFKREFIVSTRENNYRIDALIECNYNNKFYPLFVEVDYYHCSGLKRFEAIFKTGFMQSKYKEYGNDIFPTVVIIRPTLPIKQVKSDLFNITYLDFSLKDFKDKIFGTSPLLDNCK